MQNENNVGLKKKTLASNSFLKTPIYRLRKQVKKKETCQKEVGHCNNWLFPVIGDRPLKQIRPINLEKVKKNLIDAGRSPRLIQYVLATFRQIWNLARRDGIVIDEHPAKEVKKPKFDNRRLRFLTHSEAELLLEHLKKSSAQLYNMSLLALHAGMRAGEIFNLTWGHVDIEKDIIRIIDGKSGKTRVTYMTDDVKAMFENFIPGNHKDLVFTNAKGKKISEISNAFKRTVKALGLNNGATDRRMRVVFHTLRHTFASWLVEAGTDLYTVKELMGHLPLP